MSESAGCPSWLDVRVGWMSSRLDVQSAGCPVGWMSSRLDVWVGWMSVGWMSFGWMSESAGRPVGWMSSRLDVHSAGYPVGWMSVGWMSFGWMWVGWMSAREIEKPLGICVCFFLIKSGHCRLDIKPPPNGELWGENINGSFNGLVAITYFLNVLLSSAYKSFIWWECYKEATLTLVGPTSTSSLTEPGLIKIKTLTDKDKTYLSIWQWFVLAHQDHRLHGSLRHWVRMLHDFEATTVASVAGVHYASSTPSLFTACPFACSFFNFQQICLPRSGLPPCCHLWLSQWPMPCWPDRRVGARTQDLVL